MWKIAKDTITNLESEIANYRGQIQKPSTYLTTVHFLENTIKNIRNELNKQVERNKTTELRLKSYEIQFEGNFFVMFLLFVYENEMVNFF